MVQLVIGDATAAAVRRAAADAEEIQLVDRAGNPLGRVTPPVGACPADGAPLERLISLMDLPLQTETREELRARLHETPLMTLEEYEALRVEALTEGIPHAEVMERLRPLVTEHENGDADEADAA